MCVCIALVCVCGPRPTPPAQAKAQHWWDRSSPFTGQADPGRVLGNFTVDGLDERAQSFANAARQLRDETDWE